MRQITLHWQNEADRGHGSFPQGQTVRIGRSTDSDLPLPADDRRIHRQHAEVVWQGDTPVLRMVGSNPVVVAGRTLRQGETARLGDDARITISSVELHVMLSAAAEPVRMLQCHNCGRVQPYRPEGMCVQCGFALAGAETVFIDQPPPDNA